VRGEMLSNDARGRVAGIEEMEHAALAGVPLVAGEHPARSPRAAGR
jgi:hypothetical protein